MVNKGKGEKITITIPKGATTNIELGLVTLTEALVKKKNLEGGFGLGGENGYGADYENKIFMMKPYCWCEREDCKWCYGDAPNFLYKPTNCKIYWYKWIGRSQEKKGKLPKNWLKICIDSII